MSAIPSIPFHSAIPRYHQIARLLRQRMAAGAPGGLTEQALCDEFGVSRTTIRQALAELKREGLLRSRRGVGTQLVRAERAQRPYTRSSGDPLHAALGTRPRVLSIAKVPPPPEVADFLKTDEASILRIDRLHELDGAPLSLVISYLPGFVAKGIDKAALRNKTLHELLWERFGLLQKKSMHTISIARADGAIASQLGIALTEPVLHIRSRAHLDNGRPIRWTDNYFREDRYQYAAEMNWTKPKRKRK
jgi:DNA-binding GntR family transcriptional regulator